MNIPFKLSKIIENKKIEVQRLYDSGKVEIYKKEAFNKPSNRDFYKNITNPGLNLIGEFKRIAPFNRNIRRSAIPEEIAALYERCGVSAISVLTDLHFAGNLDHLQRIQRTVKLPVLRKDFIIDEAQIYESRAYNADAILLISRLLETKQLRDYINIANQLSMDVIVESHDETDLEKAVLSNPRIYGINNRDLDYFTIDKSVTSRLIPYIPEDKAIVVESGIFSYTDIKDIYDKRINAVLVGSGLMHEKINPKLSDIEAKINELLNY